MTTTPARDAIHRLFESGRTSYQLDELLDAHAAELAEKIRESTRASLTRVTATHGADWGRTWALGRERAADLIDPTARPDNTTGA